MKTKIKLTWIFTLLMVWGVLFLNACNKDGLPEPDLKADAEWEQKNNPAAQHQLLAKIRRATARYHDLDAALADGYFLDPHCVEHPELGGMGHHAINMALIGPFVVPSEPGVLVYEPKQNGRYRLVAAEYLVPAEPWDAINEGPPMLGQIPFDDHREIIYVEVMDDDGNPLFDDDGNPVLEPRNAKGGPPFPHYQLHVWVWKNNPMGMYFPFNPTVSCGYAENH